MASVPEPLLLTPGTPLELGRGHSAQVAPGWAPTGRPALPTQVREGDALLGWGSAAPGQVWTSLSDPHAAGPHRLLPFRWLDGAAFFPDLSDRRRTSFLTHGSVWAALTVRGRPGARGGVGSTWHPGRGSRRPLEGLPGAAKVLGLLGRAEALGEVLRDSRRRPQPSPARCLASRGQPPSCPGMGLCSASCPHHPVLDAGFLPFSSGVH